MVKTEKLFGLSYFEYDISNVQDDDSVFEGNIYLDKMTDIYSREYENWSKKRVCFACGTVYTPNMSTSVDFSRNDESTYSYQSTDKPTYSYQSTDKSTYSPYLPQSKDNSSLLF